MTDTRTELHTRTAPAAVEAVLGELRATLDDKITVSAPEREQHGRDEGWHDPVPPDAVVYASSTADVVAVVQACARHRVPLIPFGAGTSLEGGVAALRGGVCLDMTGMNRLLRVNAEDLDCTVEAGVTRRALDEKLRHQGLFFPIDPGADATIGGMTATRASGTNAVRYGTMRDNVLALTAVLPGGEVVHTGTRARKSSAGYDLTRLLVGSEGTLAVVTEVTLRLYGVPEVIGAAVCPFPSLHGAVAAVIETIQLGVPVARIELLDERQIMASNAYSGLTLAEVPTLFLEFHGSEQAVAEQARIVAEIAAGHDAGGWTFTTQAEERNRLWRARHDAYYADLALRPGCKGIPTDACVPISQLARCIAETRRDIDEAGLLAPIVGHVGDGNFHVIFLVDPDDPRELETAQQLNRRLVRRAQQAGGTCTGEHGIGYGKLEFMAAEHGAGVEVMRAIKRAIDPQNIMNPGKVVA
ncbi:MAG: FAD-binding protein [Euzebyales bacterium]|nr:FAD-binding protein [Euzebyales bacterium]